MSITTEVQLFSLFAKTPAMVDKVPGHIRTYCMNLNPEQICCTTNQGLNQILSILKGVNPRAITIDLNHTDRGVSEYFGDFIQIIGAVCIHDSKNVLMLELTHDVPIVDGYVKGTLTYPQGHIRYDRDVSKMMVEPNKIALNALFKKVRQDAFREVTEEIFISVPSLNHEFSTLMKQKIVEPIDATLYPIYINRPGSTDRHVCILFDVDLSGTTFDGNLELIESNEPTKHMVKVMNYKDMIDLYRVDTICPWVAKSFSMLPFYQTTFIEDYLVESRRKSAF